MKKEFKINEDTLFPIREEKEFNLSVEIRGHRQLYINLEDIKEFIRLLKEKARKYAGVNQMVLEIDKLAGKSLS